MCIPTLPMRGSLLAGKDTPTTRECRPPTEERIRARNSLFTWEELADTTTDLLQSTNKHVRPVYLDASTNCYLTVTHTRVVLDYTTPPCFDVYSTSFCIYQRTCTATAVEGISVTLLCSHCSINPHFLCLFCDANLSIEAKCSRKIEGVIPKTVVGWTFSTDNSLYLWSERPSIRNMTKD